MNIAFFLFQFSNHTGYEKGVRGRVLDDQQLSELIEGSFQDLNFWFGIQTDKNRFYFF